MNVEVFCFDAVAPVRERGLKYAFRPHRYKVCQRRSREGAWIEMARALWNGAHRGGRSREGAWIEIKVQTQAQLSMKVAPVRERGLKYRRNTAAD